MGEQCYLTIPAGEVDDRVPAVRQGRAYLCDEVGEGVQSCWNGAGVT